MVVGIGGIGQFRDPGDPYDPRRGTSVPQENASTGVPTGRFAELAAQIAAQQEESAAVELDARRMPSGVSRAQFSAAVSAAEDRQTMVTRLQTAQSPREQAAVLGEYTGIQMNDAVAETASRLLTAPDFDFDPTTAVQAAQVELSGGRATPELLQAIESSAQQAAIEPADKALNRELRNGSEEIDFDNPATAQAQSAYEDLQDEVESGFYRTQNALREVDRDERRQINSESGQGSRINGRANPFDKEKFEAQTPYKVPVIMGGQRVNARGEVAAPQITTQFKNGKPTTVLDAAQAHLALLDPAALLPQEFAENFGYTRTRTKAQTETGSYSKTPDVPTTDPSSFVVDPDGTKRYGGFAPHDDPAYTNAPTGERDVNAGSPRYVEQAPMTLGQAVDFVQQSHKTPVKTFSDDMVIAIAGDRYARNADGSRGPKLYALDNQRDSDIQAGLTAYRVGSPKMYDAEYEPEIVRLIQGASGGQFVTDQPQTVVEAPNGTARIADNAQTRMVGGERLYVGEKIGLYDQQIRDQQAQLLLSSFDDQMLGKYAEILPDDSKGSFQAVANLLARGRNLPASDGATPVQPYPQGNTDFSSADAAAADQQKLQQLGEQRQATAKKNRVRQKFKAEDTSARPASVEVQALLEMEREMAEAQALLRSEYAAAAKQAEFQDESAAASEQNTRQPQAVDAGVMNTDQVSQLNAPEPPRMRDEPTPRMQQMAAASEARTTNAVADDRASRILSGFVQRLRRNPGKAAGIGAATGLGVLGALPYDPSEGE